MGDQSYIVGEKMREDLLKILGMRSEDRPKLPKQEREVRRRIILRFKTRIKDGSGRHYYVFWVEGYTRKRYSTNPDVFSLLDFKAEIEIRKHFEIIDKEDNGKQTLWLQGLLLDKARGLID